MSRLQDRVVQAAGTRGELTLYKLGRATRDYLRPLRRVLGPVLTFTPFVRSRSWLAAGTPVRPGTGAGADVGRNWDAGREGRIGDGLLPGGGQR